MSWWTQFVRRIGYRTPFEQYMDGYFYALHQLERNETIIEGALDITEFDRGVLDALAGRNLMTVKMASNDGSYLQDELAEALKHYMSYYPAFYWRWPDTKSARGNFLKAQPGDFGLLIPEHCFLIECKSSVVHASLLSLAHHGKVGKNQIAKHRMWHRSGHYSLYLYGDVTHDTYEWHSGQNVVRKINKPLMVGSIPQLKHKLPELLKRIMELDHASTI